MPDEGYPVSPKDELLTFEEIATVIECAADVGITKVRLTGGEPLIRRDLPQLIEQVAKTKGISDISCTTNGFLLADLARGLAAAGLHRVNVSLDTLDETKFATIARRGRLQNVLNGIAAAFEVGLKPIKVNCVLMKGVNDNEVVDFAEWTLREEVHVRFIEVMPIRWNLDETDDFDTMGALHGNRDLFRLRVAEDTGMLSDSTMRRMLVPNAAAQRMIESALGPLEPVDLQTNGPARTFRVRDGIGTVGFISQISDDLCARCNRIRLTADGQLRPCLMSDGELDLRTPMRSGASKDELREYIRRVIVGKPERHYLAEGQKVLGRGMSQIGG
jgi:cyclic pyranopterin phosphate synthase